MEKGEKKKPKIRNKDHIKSQQMLSNQKKEQGQ